LAAFAYLTFETLLLLKKLNQNDFIALRVYNELKKALILSNLS